MTIVPNKTSPNSENLSSMSIKTASAHPVRARVAQRRQEQDKKLDCGLRWEEIDHYRRKVPAAQQQSSTHKSNAPEGTQGNPIILDFDTDRAFKSTSVASKEAKIPDSRCYCGVCGRTSVRRNPKLSQCTHIPETCASCYAEWITTQLRNHGWGSVKCPGSSCRVMLSYHHIRRLATPDTFRKYDSWCARKTLSENPAFRWCLSSTCGSGQIHDSGEEGNIFTCAACSYKVCTIHNVKWHEGQTCEEFDNLSRVERAREIASVQEITSSSTKCPGPGCAYNIEKVEGCDHMTCSQCRYEFCWICLADYALIRKKGNSGHGKDCKYNSLRL